MGVASVTPVSLAEVPQFVTDVSNKFVDLGYDAELNEPAAPPDVAHLPNSDVAPLGELYVQWANGSLHINTYVMHKADAIPDVPDPDTVSGWTRSKRGGRAYLRGALTHAMPYSWCAVVGDCCRCRWRGFVCAAEHRRCLCWGRG